MKKAILLIFMIGLVHVAYADAIVFYHVYYNDEKIKECNEFSKDIVITLNIEKIQKTDTLTIRYFRDVLFEDCKENIEITDNSNSVIAIDTSEEDDIGIPLKISVFDLLVHSLKTSNEKSPFFAYYYDCMTEKYGEKKLLFTILLE
jgi:hypothetical protein